MTHEIIQGEGGAQGNPLMPALFAVGQHRALVAMKDRLLPHEHLLAFLDDIYIVLERVVIIHTKLRVQLWHHGRIQTHQGKTRVWNRGQVEPANIDVLQCAARIVDPEAIIWRGSTNLPATKKGRDFRHPFGTCWLRARAFAREDQFPSDSVWGIGQWWICKQRG